MIAQPEAPFEGVILHEGDGEFECRGRNSERGHEERRPQPGGRAHRRAIGGSAERSVREADETGNAARRIGNFQRASRPSVGGGVFGLRWRWFVPLAQRLDRARRQVSRRHAGAEADPEFFHKCLAPRVQKDRSVKLFVNARCYSFDSARRRFRAYDSLLLDDDLRIAALGERPVGAGVERMDLAGATLLPAFADCHVHLTDTGYFVGPRDLSGARTYDAYAVAVSRLPRDGAMVFGGQYDESTWHDGATADARPLERFHAGARAMVTRIDGHSCIVNAAALGWLKLPPETPGIERDACDAPTGRLFLDANWRAQSAFLAAIPQNVRRAAERGAVELALARGAVHLHAQLVGFRRDEYAGEVEAMRALPAKIYPKVCEPDAALAQELGLPYVGGDVFLDGSFGSRTAALVHPYDDDPTTAGTLRFSDDEVLAYFAQADALGIAAGVHAIGDAAIDQCVRAWERVLAGKPSPRGCRHFIEHFELATADHIEACARMGIYLSMQPQFDALWAGEGGMYDERLGNARKRSMNALARIADAGAVLCGGDDSPVCELNPLLGMQACLDHHEPSERLDAHQALAMYTVDAARLSYAEARTGNLAPGLAADLVVLDRDPLEAARFGDCRVLQTWIDGRIAYALP